MSAPLDLLRQVPLFADISNRDLKRFAEGFKQNTFSPGQTIATEGTGGVGFFIIGAGTVEYSVGGEKKGAGGPGDYFGEIALIDDGPRTATVTATSEVTAYGLTPWVFRPLVEENASIAWEMLRAMAKRLRASTPET